MCRRWKCDGSRPATPFPAGETSSLKPPPFKYLVPDTLQEALALKAEYGDDAKFLAGGQSLVPMMNFRLAMPAVLLDINRIAGLDEVRETDEGALRLGALTRHRDLIGDDRIAARQPLVGEAAIHVAHPQIRNRGTLCGNLAHADPASELPAVMLALGAQLLARSSRGERWIDADGFFLGVFTTALSEVEMLAEVELPGLQPRTGTCFLEVARRRGDFAMMGVAAVVSLSEDGTCSGARLAYCGAGPTAMAATEAAASLAGQRLDDRAFEAAAEIMQTEIDPSANVNAGIEYQRHLAGVLTRRALRQALERARCP